MAKQIIIFLGGNYNSDLQRVEQVLPKYLSQSYQTYCFEYPQFRKLFKILLGIIPLTEKISPNLYIYHSFGLFPGGRNIAIFNKINHWLNFKLFNILFKKNEKSTNFISFTPETAYLKNKIKSKHIIYYAIDDYIALPFWKNYLAKKQFKTLEKKFVKYSQKIITVSTSLCLRYKKLHPDVFYFPTPFDSKEFENTNYSVPSDLAKLKKPIIGFIGAFYDWRINLKLLLKTFSILKNYSFVAIGSLKIKNKFYLQKLQSLSNFYYLGHKENYEVGNYIQNFKVCLIPYKTNTYGQYAYPVKINEYLNFGKPIVSTNLPAIEELGKNNLIYWALNNQDFIKKIKSAVNENKNNQIIKKRKIYALNHSWKRQLKNLIKIIEK